MYSFNLPPIFDWALIILVAAAAIICFAQYRTPRINGGEHIQSARLIKAFGYGLLALWYGYRLIDMGDIRISAVAAVAISLVAFADLFSGVSRIGQVANAPRGAGSPAAH